MHPNALGATVRTALLARPGRDGVSWAAHGKEPMAKPNYQYEKRQRELEKKRKKEEKAMKKSTGDKDGPDDSPEAPEEKASGSTDEAAPAA